MADLDNVFAADGALARAIPGYRVRPQQIEMAGRIAAAVQSHGVLVAEAGTGTGKTFAYLVPAQLAGGAFRRGIRHAALFHSGRQHGAQRATEGGGAAVKIIS